MPAKNGCATNGCTPTPDPQSTAAARPTPPEGLHRVRRIVVGGDDKLYAELMDAPGGPSTPPPLPEGEDPSEGVSAGEQSALRGIVSRWRPRTMGEARAFAEECLARAPCVAGVLTEYSWASTHSSWADLHGSLELLTDLLEMSASLSVDWWDDEERLVHHGWHPPTREEGQA